MKKTVILIVVITLSFLAACSSGSEDNSIQASDTPSSTQAEVATPSPTPSPSPSPVHVHTLSLATCQEPPTCSECGETEGDSLPHDWREANYQEPQECLVCGEADGLPLPPNFLTLGLTLCDLDTQYPYVAATGEDIDTNTVGLVEVLNNRVIEGDDVFEAKEGFEWRMCTVRFAFFDDNAMAYGTTWACDFTDYYEISLETVVEASNEDVVIGLTYYGMDFELDLNVDFIVEERIDGWGYDSDGNDVFAVEIDGAWRVPVGYDGMLIAVYNYGNDVAFRTGDESQTNTLGNLTDEDTLWFRLA